MQVLDRLARGGAVALISDAGMPAVSDPGAKLIAAAVRARHTVIPVPGERPSYMKHPEFQPLMSRSYKTCNNFSSVAQIESLQS